MAWTYGEQLRSDSAAQLLERLLRTLKIQVEEFESFDVPELELSPKPTVLTLGGTVSLMGDELPNFLLPYTYDWTHSTDIQIDLSDLIGTIQHYLESLAVGEGSGAIDPGGASEGEWARAIHPDVIARIVQTYQFFPPKPTIQDLAEFLKLQPSDPYEVGTVFGARCLVWQDNDGDLQAILHPRVSDVDRGEPCVG